MPRTRGAKNMTADAVLRRDFLSTYRKLGGKKWLEQWARDNPAEFAKAMISKVTQPAAAKPTEVEQPATALSDWEGARHVAFVLAKALYEGDMPLVVDGEVVVERKPTADWQAPAWMPPADQPAVEPPQQGAVEEQPALPAPEPAPEDKPERRSLADLLGFEPPSAPEPHLYGPADAALYRSGDPAEQGGSRRGVRVVQRETVVEKYRRMKGG